ncbi:uncharacterized protein [Amphiura filiformis]|uniref:uncharacterized protein n=1 Tax=Amphiura filiformis TaxID=82378 RepID=UPI003B214E08
MDFSSGCSDSVSVFLRCLANQLGSEWMELAIYLDFRADEVDRINLDYSRTSDKIYAMLNQCRHLQGTGANLKSILQDALKKCGRQDLAIKVKDEFPSVSRAVVHQGHHDDRSIPWHNPNQPRILILQPVIYVQTGQIQLCPIYSSCGLVLPTPTQLSYAATNPIQFPIASTQRMFALPSQTSYAAPSPIQFPNSAVASTQHGFALPTQTSNAATSPIQSPYTVALPSQASYASTNPIQFPNYSAVTSTQHRFTLPSQTSYAAPSPIQFPNSAVAPTPHRFALSSQTSYAATSPIQSPNSTVASTEQRFALPTQTSHAAMGQFQDRNSTIASINWMAGFPTGGHNLTTQTISVFSNQHSGNNSLMYLSLPLHH